MQVRPHDRFSREVQLEPSMVAEFARSTGDSNPIHHDPDFAARTRFGRPIASGTHTSGLLLGLTASHFSQYGAMLGLEFWVQLRRAVYADEKIKLEWLVIRVTPHARWGGDVVDLRGRVTCSDGRTAIGAKGRVLVTPSP